MRFGRIPLASSLALVIALALAPQASALPDNPVDYTVYYSCHVSPGGCNPNGDWYGCLVGEWALACNGRWYGWGMRPYTSCAEIVDAVVGEPCDPWGEWQSGAARSGATSQESSSYFLNVPVNSCPDAPVPGKGARSDARQ